jgi:hypothetical protein
MKISTSLSDIISLLIWSFVIWGGFQIVSSYIGLIVDLQERYKLMVQMGFMFIAAGVAFFIYYSGRILKDN